MKVVILGATIKSDRFAFKAQQMLIDHGHKTFPVSLSGDDILGQKGYQQVSEIECDEPIDSVTVYLNPNRFADIIDQVIKLGPARLILNPGTESAGLSDRFTEAGIEVIEDCTLVMLKTGRF